MWILTALLALLPKLNTVNTLLNILASVLAWIWQNVFWVGLKGIFDGLPQVLTFAALAGVIYFAGDLLHDTPVRDCVAPTVTPQWNFFKDWGL